MSALSSSSDWPSFLRRSQKSRQKMPQTAEEIRAYQQAYREKNRKRLADYARVYQAAHRAELKEYYAKWKTENPGKKSFADKVWRERNPAYKKESDAEYYARNRDKVRACSMKNYKTPKSKFNRYAYNAKHRGIAFELSFDQFMSFWQKDCYYCGREIETIGIDRIDNSLGYSLGNVVSCCGPCNYAKQELSVASFVAMCCRVAAKHGGM